MRICPYDGNLEIVRLAFSELFNYDEIDRDMWNEILKLGQAAETPDLIKGLSSYSKIRCMFEVATDEFGFVDEFFATDRWFADGVTALGTVGVLIGDDKYCFVKGYDKNFELYTVQYINEDDISDLTVPAITEKSGDFVVGVPGLVGTYKYAILLMKKQEGN